MSGCGWFSIQRKLLDSDFWLSEKFSRGQAWIDLVGLANHKPGFIRKRGIKIKVKRGQVGWSEVALGERWKWSRGKVRRFLNELKAEQQINKQPVQQNKFVTSLINIINYELYQKNSTANGQQTVQQTDSRQYRNNNNNNNNYTDVCKNLISTINILGNKKFRLIQSNFDLIIPRLKEGFTEEDCLKVINNKNRDPNFNIQYFKPETLFRKSKFEGYLNENPKQYKPFKNNQKGWKRAF